ncbi:MAG TPA: hypothetical protein EYP62_04865, partial [Kiritimatiellae bacterium]|nr:hypothetical protein [Kiritimatiellia bacterium]
PNDQVWCFGVRAEDSNGLMEANTVMQAAGPISGTGDTDGDCLINSLESSAGTGPCLADSDLDQMWDGWEWTYSTNNPAHTNSFWLDPLDNGEENYRTPTTGDGDPDQAPDADPDGDGASNLEEFQWWYSNTYLAGGGLCDPAGPTNRIGPDPTLSDTDGDGMADGWEMFNDLNPVDPSDGALDADGDGLNNSNEFAYGCDPLNADSDSDGISDGEEIGIHGTDPSLADTDRDGLDDGFELYVGSSPVDADSNDSFVSDGDTFQLGWDSPAAPLTNFNILLYEDFEPGSPTRADWTHYWTDGNHPYDFWHLSSAEPAPKSNAVHYLWDHSTTTCYRMAIDPTGTNPAAGYSTGSIIQCALESPLIDARTVSNLFVAWNEYYQTEPAWDIVLVQARGGADSNWYVVSDTLSGDSGAWTSRVADLSRFAGMSNVSVRFLFSAQNDINNYFAGWFVDDVRIYEGVAFTGWVRDINGRPVPGAEVLALGRGGITNAISGHRFINPGKILGRAITADDGSYFLAGLPQGKYYLKVSMPGYRDEFYNGDLFSAAYAFGNELNPGVFHRDQVGPSGYLDLTDAGATAVCHFEIEKGSSRARLGVVLEDPSGLTYPVTLNFYCPSVWNGVTNLDTNIPPVAALTAYTTSTNILLADNHPDWLTNPVPPAVFADLMSGEHVLQLGTNFDALPWALVSAREGELTIVAFATNQGQGRLYVTAPTDSAYRVWVDGRDTGREAPALIPLRAGRHLVNLAHTNGGLWLSPREVTIPLGRRVRVDFSTNEVIANPGFLLVTTEDINGNEVTGATVLVDGQVISSNDVSWGYTAVTPTRIDRLKPGLHFVSVYKDGYAIAPARRIVVASGVENQAEFVLEAADADFDLDGDAIEVAGYTNVFLYHREDDPDGDGLNNLFEYEQFRLFNVFLNPFEADSDGDGVSDGDELGFDGFTNLLAYSTAASNIVENGDTVPIRFVGHFLSGSDNFGTGNVAAAIECDRFEAGTMSHPPPPVPGVEPALTMLSAVPAGIAERSVDQGHYVGSIVLADPLPDQQDTDGDGMWDGFEFRYHAAGLNPIECSAAHDDPDGDGADNLREFLGADYVANTNDWSDPTNYDSDNDSMPDGWEYDHGLNPTDPADADEDPDGDGLVNRDEFASGADPQLYDTDADGLPDGPEVLLYGTRPYDADCDGDGLKDGEEVWDRDLDGQFDGGFFQFPSNQPPGDLDGDGNPDGPLDWDTDGDGMPDKFEVVDDFGNVRSPALNPYDPNDADEDYDGDGLSNLEEYRIKNGLAGNPPGTFDPDYADVVWDYSTDPFNPDSDGDGLPDGWEAVFGLHPMDPIPTADGMRTRFPVLGPSGDVDHDGLFNGREYSVRFHLHEGADSNAINEASTNPWDPDSDRDGLKDGEEDRSFRCSPVVQDSDLDNLADGTDMPDMWGEVESATRNPDGSPAVTNHYDQALNDLWRLVWPASQPLPSWQRVVPDTNSPLPEPRWAALAAYNPVFETKTFEFSGNTYESILLDNRQIVIMGGRDGVERFTNIWEFVIRSNAWVRSLRSLGDIGLTNGLSEGAAVVLLGYHDSRAELCPCDENQPYQCGATAFGLPKERPWDFGYQRSSFDWTFILGGWDKTNLYYFARPMPSHYYKSTDSHEPVTDWSLVQSEGNNDGTLQGETIVPIATPAGGLQQTGSWDVASEGWNNAAVTGSSAVAVGSGVTNGMFFDQLGIESGSTIASATLHMNFNSYGAATAQLSIVAELLVDGRSSSDYDADPPTWRKIASQFISSTQTFVLASSAIGTISTNLDVSALVAEAVSQANWAEESIGFLVFGETIGGSNFYLRVGESQLSVAWQVPSPVYDYYGMFFDDIFIRTNCEQVLKAELELHLTSTALSSNDMQLVGELWSDGQSSGDYNGIPVTNRISGLGELLTAPISFPLVVNGSTVTSIDITPVFLELVQYSGWAAQSCGFIMWGLRTGAEAYMYVGKAVLKVTYLPSYKSDAYWQLGTHLQVSQDQPAERKSLGMVYDYKRDRIVVFGGMDGEKIYGDTYEGTPVWNDLGGEISYSNPSSVGSPRLILWEKIDVSPSPSPRWGHSMVYDPVNERVVLFGGFNAEHAPLNDLWTYSFQTWHQVTVFADNQRPAPRGGAAMVFFGGFMYDRGYSAYCMDYETNALVLFGGTDGKIYFNDTWVYDHRTSRWILVNPSGEFSPGPSPRAFASFVFAQNAGGTPDPDGTNTFLVGDPENRCATPAAYLFGGRMGALPTSPDTDGDLVPDGWEHSVGGPAAGHDPRVNALLPNSSTNEQLPFCYVRIGSVLPDGDTRGTLADLEALSYSEGDFTSDYARVFNLPYQGYPLESPVTGDVFATGVDGYLPQYSNLWYHRDGEGGGPGDVWELGRPDPSSVGTDAVPAYAHSGRWCFGTDLNGRYPNSVRAELYSPLFNLRRPPVDATCTNNSNTFYLIFYEWLNLHDADDIVQIDALLPRTPADIANREAGTNVVTIMPARNDTWNTTGDWRLVAVPLDQIANESNVFLRFTLLSDSSGNGGGWYIDDVAIASGGEIEGLLTNSAGALDWAQVVLLGSESGDAVLSETWTDSSGAFEFGLLPLGSYRLGAVSSIFGPFTLSPTNWTYRLGSTGVPPLVVSSATPGDPVTISWPAVPGLSYELQYVDSLGDPWQTLAIVTAASTNEVWYDYSAAPMRMYRVLMAGP